MNYDETTINGTWYTGEPDREMWVFAHFSTLDDSKGYVFAMYFRDSKWWLPTSASFSSGLLESKDFDVTPTHWMPFPEFANPNKTKNNKVSKQNIKMKFIGS
jgi:Protein of unknown function (DUF551)